MSQSLTSTGLRLFWGHSGGLFHRGDSAPCKPGLFDADAQELNWDTIASLMWLWRRLIEICKIEVEISVIVCMRYTTESQVIEDKGFFPLWFHVTTNSSQTLEMALAVMFIHKFVRKHLLSFFFYILYERYGLSYFTGSRYIRRLLKQPRLGRFLVQRSPHDRCYVDFFFTSEKFRYLSARRYFDIYCCAI